MSTTRRCALTGGVPGPLTGWGPQEDFYAVQAAGKDPPHDVLVNNPPYSASHVRKLLQFCVSDPDRPFLLLMPNYCYLKDYYEALFDSMGTCPFFVIPPARISYKAPQARPSGWAGLTGLGRDPRTRTEQSGKRRSVLPHLSFRSGIFTAVHAGTNNC